MKNASIVRAFEETERKSEVFAAITRMIIAIVIMAAAWLSTQLGPASHPLMVVSIIYALVSLIGIVLAFLKVMHISIPYAFTAIDMGVLAMALTMLAQMHNLKYSHEFSLPIFSLSYVILIHAALRYRPYLILFGFSFFILLLYLLPLVFSLPFVDYTVLHTSHSHEILPPSQLAMHDVGALPMMFLMLATALLFFIVKRTRSVTEIALADARRVDHLSRFFSPEVASSLSNVDVATLKSGQKVRAAIIFVDIRGFSLIAENRSPEEVVELVSALRTLISEIILKHKGTVDKFIGDAVLAVFGAPVSHQNDAFRAVTASLEIRDQVNAWYQDQASKDQPRAKVGIGGHIGEVFSGIIKSGQILEHSVLGDAVNVAQRLERLTREYKSDVMFSDQLVSASNVKNNFRSVEDVKVRGHKNRLKVWYG